MTAPVYSAMPLPSPDLGFLRPLSAPDVLAAWVAGQPKNRCKSEAASKTLDGVVPFEETLAGAIKLGLVQNDGVMLAAKAECSMSASTVKRGGAQDALKARLRDAGSSAGGNRAPQPFNSSLTRSTLSGSIGRRAK